MGSTGTYREKGMTDRAFFENEFPTMLGKTGHILACKSLPAGGEWNRVFYAAVQNHDDAEYTPGKVWCLVVLMHNMRNSRDGMNFYYKDLSDSMGPAEDTCPASILDLLSPTDSKYSNEWRARCRKAIAQAEKSKIADGTIVEFGHPFKFVSGHEAARFRFVKEGRRTYWAALDQDNAFRFNCRLPKTWHRHDFTIVRTPAV